MGLDKGGTVASNRDQVMAQGNAIFVIAADGHFYPLAGNTAGAASLNVLNTETIQTPLLAAQTIAASTNVLSSTVSVIGVKSVLLFIDHARAATAAFGTNGTEYRVEVSEQATGNDTWSPIASVLCASAVCNSAASSSDCAAGTTLITITSGTAMPTTGYTVFTSGTIEWVQPTIATGTASFNVLDATRYAHVSATGIFSGGEKFVMNLDVEAATRMRVVVNNIASATTQPIASRIAYNTTQ
jgi:hypothetical protein